MERKRERGKTEGDREAQIEKKESGDREDRKAERVRVCAQSTSQSRRGLLFPRTSCSVSDDFFCRGSRLERATSIRELQCSTAMSLFEDLDMEYLETLNLSEASLNASLAWLFEDGWGAAEDGWGTAAPFLPRADLLAVSAVYGVVFLQSVVYNMMKHGELLGPITIVNNKDIKTVYLNVTSGTNTGLHPDHDCRVTEGCRPAVTLCRGGHQYRSDCNTACVATFAGKLTPFFEVLVFQASILTMVAVSADRYQGVCHPLRTQLSNRRRRALLSIAAVWGLSLAASSPVLSIATYTELDMNGTLICQCISTVDAPWKNHYTTIITVGFFVLPLVALSVMYFAIGKRLTRPPAGETNAHLQAQHRSRRRVVLMVGTVVAVFFVCLLPHRLFQMWILYAPVEQIDGLGLQGFVKLTIFMRMMVYINCSLNPIIYTLFSSRFRAAFFKCCFKSSERSDSLGQASHSELAHRNTIRDRNHVIRDMMSEEAVLNSFPTLPARRRSNVTSSVALTRLSSFPVSSSVSNAGYDEPCFKQECREMCVYVWESHV
uniref:G-protein coupled receptors family 1 profile domain-containing protein n=2 Tax=Branchiostoma floridae TaxID=7739 RepID=C3XVE0_BRAFL|eukprot:XP_002612057.1 hypothetical protein BRAFLDRAFT_94147 [Branchiostoma floridae]